MRKHREVYDSILDQIRSSYDTKPSSSVGGNGAAAVGLLERKAMEYAAQLGLPAEPTDVHTDAEHYVVSCLSNVSALVRHETARQLSTMILTPEVAWHTIYFLNDDARPGAMKPVQTPAEEKSSVVDEKNWTVN